ncbi:Lish domain-containing [Elysia marginata]|uniref:Lish domain-containing n=1 Tax=Elysia marginata TaxID=1093978 RepID=A0AAV4GFL8_9GAST|nr:Lish domain-containing [Elysia marginata]
MDPTARKLQPLHMATAYPDDMPMVDFDSRMIRAITQQPWASAYQPPPPNQLHHPQQPPALPHPQPSIPQFSGKDMHVAPSNEQSSTVTVLDIGQTHLTDFNNTAPQGPSFNSTHNSNPAQVERSRCKPSAPPTMVHIRQATPQKRQRNPELWKKNVRKRARQMGQAYVTDTGREVPARKIREGCGSSCRLGCQEKFDQASREDLFQTFWGLEDKGQQRLYIARHVIKCDIARKRVEASDRRGFTLKYYFYNGKELSQVCRKFFVETLDVGRDFIYGTLEKEDPKTGLIAPERQGKHGKQRRVSEAVLSSVREHILTFPTVDAQNGKSKSKRQYLEAGLSVAKMYRMYKEYCAARNIQDVASADRYRRVFDEDFNLTFLKAKKT